MNTRKMRNTKGITLVALIVTIIVLLILAGISLNLIMGEKGITQRAVNAGKMNNIAGAKEKLELQIADYAGEYYQAKYVNRSVGVSDVGSYVLGKFSPEETIFEENYYLKKENSKLILTSSDRTTTATCTVDSNGKVEWEGTEIDDDSEEDLSGTPALADVSYKGYFADLNGDGVINVEDDGVIYVDLLAQSGEMSQWENSNASYEIPSAGAPSSYNTYYVGEETMSIGGQTGYGEQKMIKLASSSGNHRFYVMALQDFSTTNYTAFYWYRNAGSKMNTSDTSVDFGTGKENTKNMLDIWNERNGKTSYAVGDNQDLWKYIDGKYNDGWFVPSRAEWAAFGKALNITGNFSDSTFYGNFGLKTCYWLSSQHSATHTWMVDFYEDYIYTAVTWTTKPLFD